MRKRDSIERALGIHWHLETDKFQFKITMKDSPLTKRGILSTISSIYDPLGIAGPFILAGRKILQQISALKDGWDTPVPQELSNSWIKWRQNIPLLEQINIPRCYKPVKFGAVVHRSLHIFSDASEVGYGVACYLRQVDSNGQVSVSLVLGKSRVSPLKLVTIPRLELTAAAVSVRLSAMVKKELMMPNIQDIYWTDSKIVLGYIFNHTKRFRVFVANRVQKILSCTEKNQWYYVDTKSNPADHASRGISVQDKIKSDQWLWGPEFLHNKEEAWSKLTIDIPNLSADDVEIRKPIVVHATKVEESVLEKFENFPAGEKWCVC